MGHIREPEPVKLICSIIAVSDGFLQPAETALMQRFGSVDFTSEILPFEHTAYYEREFGPNLVRQIVAFAPLIDPGELASVKRATNSMEGQWAVAGRRRVNLDPGYVSEAKLVLATTKNHGHRIYLRDGIYGEVTLRYRNGRFQPWEWTYPDYGSPAYCALFETIRSRYRAQLRARSD
jgi:hypothetical protein